MQHSERDNTQTSTAHARACRKPGQRLKKAERRKLQQQFLDVAGTVQNGEAMEALGLSRFTLYAWLRGDPDFKARYEAKMATFELKYEPMSDEQYELVAQRLAMLPEREIMRRAKMQERMAARRGEPHTIWW